MRSFARPSSGMLRVLSAQAVLGSVAILISGLFSGWVGAASALIGVSVYLVPNAVFALHLWLGLAGSGRASALTFVVGEFVKIMLALVILALAAKLAASWLVWWALLLGLVCVLKGYILLLLLRKLA